MNITLVTGVRVGEGALRETWWLTYSQVGKTKFDKERFAAQAIQRPKSQC